MDAPRGEGGEADVAIVIGVARYPELGHVLGAEARARAFEEWLLSPRGGGLPAEHVRSLIPTRRLRKDSPRRDRPFGEIAMEGMVEWLFDLVKQRGGRIGRRLYLYVSGRAVVVDDDVQLLGPEGAEPSVLLSTAMLLGLVRSVGMVDEVVLVADLAEGQAPGRRPIPFPVPEAPARSVTVSLFSAVSLSPRLSSDEPVESEQASSVSDPDVPALGPLGFTGALLDALGGGPTDADGRITGDTVAEYLQAQGWHEARDDWTPRLRCRVEGEIVFRPGVQAHDPEERVAMPNAHALIIGISDYADLPGLTTAASDAGALADALLDPDSGGYAREHVRLLIDRQATRAAVVEALHALARECDDDSTLLIYFAGHGTRSGSAQRQALLLVLADAIDPGRTAITDPTALGIPARELQGLVEAIPAAHVVHVFDCSHASAGLAARPGRVVLAACGADEVAHESGTGGDFTRRIVNALRGGAPGDGPHVTVFDVFEYAQAAVAREGRQHPVILATSREDDCAIAVRPSAPYVPSMLHHDGYRYDVYVSFAPLGSHSQWVWQVLLPRLTQAGLHVAVSEPVATGRTSQVVTVESGVRGARHTVVLLTEDYLATDTAAELERVLGDVETPAPPRRLVGARLDASVAARSRLRHLLEHVDLVQQAGSDVPELGELLHLLGVADMDSGPKPEKPPSGAPSDAVVPDPSRPFDFACMLCYAFGAEGTPQARFATALARELEVRLGRRRSEPVWVEWERLDSNSRYDDQLGAALERSACVLVVGSQAYFASPYAQRFLTRALALEGERRERLERQGLASEPPVPTVMMVVQRDRGRLPGLMDGRELADMSDWGRSEDSPGFTERHLADLDRIVDLIATQCEALEELGRRDAEQARDDGFDPEVTAEYQATYAAPPEVAQMAVQDVAPDPSPRVATRRWFLTARPATAAPVAVGDAVAIELAFSATDQPGAVPLRVPVTALELAVYVDAPAFQVDGVQPRTLPAVQGDVAERRVAVPLVALAGGRHEVRLTVHAGGGVAGIAPAALSCAVDVAAAVALPDVRELVDRRAIPNPQPAVTLHVVLERDAAGTERLRVHVTCPALALDRARLDEPLAIGAGDAAALRAAAASAAASADGVSPPDAAAALRAFGATLFDRLFPAGHALRDFLWRVLPLAASAPRPPTWLVVADEGALLPWELACAHGWDADHRHWYDDFLARRFVVAHWVARRGLQLADEAPVGAVGLVHYGRHDDELALWRAALGGDEVAGVADPTLSLDVLGGDSPWFGVHLLRHADPRARGAIVAADGVTAAASRDAADGAGEAVAGCRLDYTRRRPVVGLSLVHATGARAGGDAARDTRLEQAWALPFLDARVTAVVGPRWTTSPEGDRLFFRAFYAAAHAGVPLGRAAWEARERVRAAFPDRADWLAYAYFGHPECEPYAVEEAEGFTVFEPIDADPDGPFEAGRTYRFRASYRHEMPAWYAGRLRVRRDPMERGGVSVLVAPAFGTAPATYELEPVRGSDDPEVPSDDCAHVVELTMPADPGTLPVFVQFTRGGRELRSAVVALAVAGGDA